jgi:hypothetical protein
MPDPTAPERHEPKAENACGTERDYGSGIIHLCEWTAGRCTGTHTCMCGLFWTAPVTADDLRERYAEALYQHAVTVARPTPFPPHGAEERWLATVRENAHARAAAVLAVRDEELERLRARLAEEIEVSGLLDRRAETSEGEHGATREREAELRRNVAAHRAGEDLLQANIDALAAEKDAAEAAAKLAVAALEGAETTCRYHGDTPPKAPAWHGGCESCQQPTRVREALAAIRALTTETENR